MLGLAGCDSVLQAMGLRTEEPIAETSEDDASEQIGTQALTVSETGSVLRNEEADIEITLPATWSEDDRLHDSAELEASDIDQQLYLVVVAEENDSLLRLGLRENAENYRKLLIDRLQAFQGESPTDLAFVGDHFASQYEIRGDINENTAVVYLHTTVVTERRYYQIVAWTTPEQYDVYKSELETITETFREIGS